MYWAPSRSTQAPSTGVRAGGKIPLGVIDAVENERNGQPSKSTLANFDNLALNHNGRRRRHRAGPSAPAASSWETTVIQ